MNDDSIRLWAKTLNQDSRVLVTGASGWFGKTAVEMCRRAHIRCLAITRVPKSIAEDENVTVRDWNEKFVEEFKPTDVIDCAFQTREKLSEIDLNDFITQNEMLIGRVKWLSGLESVQRVLTVSSGAAVYPNDALLLPVEANPYGFLKRKAELVMAESAKDFGVASVVARAWSVSGGFCGKTSVFAFTDLLVQTFNGDVAIKATKNVWRRYVSVEDLLAVSLASSQLGKCVIVDSGGELVELEDLALKMASNVNPNAKVNTGRPKNDPDDAYFSDVRVWEEAVMKTGYIPLTLDQQIQNVARALALTNL